MIDKTLVKGKTITTRQSESGRVKEERQIQAGSGISINIGRDLKQLEYNKNQLKTNNMIKNQNLQVRVFKEIIFIIKTDLKVRLQ